MKTYRQHGQNPFFSRRHHHNHHNHHHHNHHHHRHHHHHHHHHHHVVLLHRVEIRVKVRATLEVNREVDSDQV